MPALRFDVIGTYGRRVRIGLFSRRAVLRQAQDGPEPGRRAGVVAGLMLALYAPAIFFDGLLQKSVLDVFFICLALWLIAGITVRLKPDTTETKVRLGGDAANTKGRMIPGIAHDPCGSERQTKSDGCVARRWAGGAWRLGSSPILSGVNDATAWSRVRDFEL